MHHQKLSIQEEVGKYGFLVQASLCFIIEKLSDLRSVVWNFLNRWQFFSDYQFQLMTPGASAVRYGKFLMGHLELQMSLEGKELISL